MKTTLAEHQVFAAVVDSGSITAAAEQLGQTVSGVSRSLARLEHKLETTLLARTTRRTKLTDEGLALLPHSRALLDAAEDAEQAMATRRQQPAGTLRINAAPTFMHAVIAPHVGAFRERYPQIRLSLDTHDRFIDLLEQRTDVAIRIGALEDSTLHARPLGHTRLRLVASPAYLARCGTPTTVADLAGHALLGFNQMPHLNAWPVRDNQGRDLHIEPTIAASSASTLIALALAGEGIASMADYATRSLVAEGRLQPVLADRIQTRRQAIHAVYYRNTALALRIQLFLDFLAERLPAAL
ncbi:LysR family transcriptional regulator [Endozoicomonas sp. G2_2]|uniref:LysR substrate-binding domain-containing protein n=1 Tax=Endozoicomonas sp. G2_2 TaxID=2821092 RepID=UPI001ADCFC6F|nr:LysR substrate-binding domain-containing protein [Endozoicomonas sp. G2_2]MBO9470534.1 LysR family transcriptional regulator [Endozoicomonas sp. G2_2]